MGCSLICAGSSGVLYSRYWKPRKKSHDAWNIPEILKDQGISDFDVKNQNSFIVSPPIQAAKTDNRRPLDDLVRALIKIWGIGSVASTPSPMHPIAFEYTA
jgi:hypothetical protein